jgi:hypothetical protein
MVCMMRRNSTVVVLCLALVSQLFFALLPSAAQGKTFLAVFNNPGEDFQQEWVGKPVNYLQIGYSWRDLDSFLSEVAQRADASDNVVIDIDCHGSDGGLWLQYEDPTKNKWISRGCSVGYVVNEIDKYLSDKNVTLLLEACYSGRAYRKTIRKNEPWFRGGYIPADHIGVPRFPIYGIGSSTVNFGNYIYLQYTHPEQRLHFEDLRHYEKDVLKRRQILRSAATVVVYLDFLMLEIQSENE